jgi:hypothetical protein
MLKALHRVEEISTSGLGRLAVGTAVPKRRIAELARYGLGARAAQLKRHSGERRIATLVATVQRVEARAIDDALELLDLLMLTELLGKAHRKADKQTVRRQPKLARASAYLAAAVDVLLEAIGWGPDVQLAEVWEAIEAVVPRTGLRAAVDTVIGMVPPAGVDDDDDGWREEMAGRIATVASFVKLLTKTIKFGATVEGAPILAAMRCLGKQLDSYRKWNSKNVHVDVVTGPWKRLVLGHPARTDGSVSIAEVDLTAGELGADRV